MPENTGETRNDLGQWKKGVSGNPAGKPPGSLSIKARIRQIFMEEPETFEEVVRSYVKDRKMRDLLWRMLEGNPKTDVKADVTGTVNVVSNVPEEE